MSAHFIHGGVDGDGTLVRVGLPVMLSYRDNRDPRNKWCVDLSVHLTALKLSADLFLSKAALAALGYKAYPVWVWQMGCPTADLEGTREMRLGAHDDDDDDDTFIKVSKL